MIGLEPFQKEIPENNTAPILKGCDFMNLGSYNIAWITPPSTRSAAPLVPDDNGLAI
jgi:hypothetical protein